MTQKGDNKPRVFSGAQPTGNMHLGNYLGALRNWARMQDDHDCIYCVVDMHAITVFQDPATLTQQTREAAAAYIASGMNPDNCILFNQSAVSGHAELAWVFNCVARMGWLNRMTQFKDKAGKHKEKASVGLFIYPNLMAADILLYRATRVPVGGDQKQHLELTRDIAQKFNNDFGVELFPEVEPVFMGPATRVMSLRDGTKKMSKSDVSDMTRINLTDDADVIATKIRKARTDMDGIPAEVEGLKGRDEVQNLVQIYAALADITPEEVCAKHAGEEFRTFKEALTEVAVEALSPVTARMRELMQDPAEIDRILARGAEAANSIAEVTMKEVRKAVGFLG